MEQQNKKKNKWLSYVFYACVFIISWIATFCIIKYFQSNPVIVSGESMEPTYHSGEIVMGREDFTAEDIDYGSIVVLTPPGERTDIIKRIVAKPGDTIWINEGILYVNGEASPWQFDKIEHIGVLSKPLIIGSDFYFAMGDNRNHSRDSRDFGQIHISRIKILVD